MSGEPVVILGDVIDFGDRRHFKIPIGKHADGSSVDLSFSVLAGSRPGAVVGVVASVDRGCWPSANAALGLIDSLTTQTMSGSVIVVPMADPVGFQPTASAVGNLDTAFGPAANGILAQMAQGLIENVLVHLDALIEIRCGAPDVEGFSVVAGRDYSDTRLSERSISMAHSFGHPYVRLADLCSRGPGPLSMLSFVADHFGVPTVIVEMDGSGGVWSRRSGGHTWAISGIMNMLQHLEVIDGPGPTAEVALVDRAWPVISDASGIFSPSLGLGDDGVAAVEAGDLLGFVLNARTLEPEERLVAPVSGFVTAIRRPGLVLPGEWALIINERAESDLIQSAHR